MVSRDEVIAATFAALDLHARPASIAEIGGFRPSEEPITSYFGGQFVALHGQIWPLYEGRPMTPLLQVRTDELPFRPQALEGIALFNVFTERRDVLSNVPAENGAGWLLRTYPSLDGLSPLTPPSQPQVRAFPVRWIVSELEGPDWKDAWRLADLTEFNKLADAAQLFHERYRRHTHTKVGGWANYRENVADLNGYVFQISSEEKARWMWDDDVNAHFFLREGKWFLDQGFVWPRGEAVLHCRCGYESDAFCFSFLSHVYRCGHCRAIVFPDVVPFVYSPPKCNQCTCQLRRQDRIPARSMTAEHCELCPRCQERSLRLQWFMHVLDNFFGDSIPHVGELIHARIMQPQLDFEPFGFFSPRLLIHAALGVRIANRERNSINNGHHEFRVLRASESELVIEYVRQLPADEWQWYVG